MGECECRSFVKLFECADRVKIKLKVTYKVYYTCGWYLGPCIKRETVAMFKDIIANEYSVYIYEHSFSVLITLKNDWLYLFLKKKTGSTTIMSLLHIYNPGLLMSEH